MENTKVTGRVWKYGSNVDTDAIIPARYLNVSIPSELAKHALEDFDPRFAAEVQPGDIIVATANFGCGSSREHAPLALKAASVGAIIAETFARIFYRNAINVGLPIMECAEAVADVQHGQLLEVDLKTGHIQNLTTGKQYQATPLPDFLLQIREEGGLMEKIVADVGAADPS
jgi:3-isopropylmalate/(R)-2-methylmalate dehydratase small subunit